RAARRSPSSSPWRARRRARSRSSQPRTRVATASRSSSSAGGGAAPGANAKWRIARPPSPKTRWSSSGGLPSRPASSSRLRSRASPEQRSRVAVELLHAEVVHVRAAVDGRLRDRLGDGQEPARGEPRPHPRRQLVEAAGVADGRAFLAAEEPEPAAGAELEHGGGAERREPVLAVAEEHEG